MEFTDARSLSPEAQQALRERVMAAVTGGMSQAEAARAFGVHPSTVSVWWGAYRRGGPGALTARPRGRRPRGLLTAEQSARLWAVLTTSTPDRHDLPEQLWTREAVADWAAAHLGVRRSRWVWGRWLKRAGFTPQKPARRAYEQNPAAVERWLAAEYPRVERAAKAAGAEVHWLDEAGVRSDCQAGRGYAPRGRTPVVRVPGTRFAVNFLATLTNRGVMRFSVYAGRFTQDVFVAFLARLAADRPGKVVLILDGHPAHRGRRVREWVAAQGGRVRLVFLPPYSPELNPVELLNNDVKANAQRPGRARDQGELGRQVRDYLRATQRHRTIVRNYFQAPLTNYAA
jgi:transposase